MAQPYACQTVLKWLKDNLGPRCLAPMTSTDSKALAAAVQTIELYAFERNPELLRAFGVIVRCMQPSCRHLAFHAIASVMDWPDRALIWRDADLPMINPGRCAYEPAA